MSSRADELDDDLFDAVSLDGLTAQQRFQEASKVAERAIEALRETEAELQSVREELGEEKRVHGMNRAASIEHKRQRDEARAQRDLLHEHLSEQAVGVSTFDGSLRCMRCGATNRGHMELEDHKEDCVLREVERGSVLEQARREARSELAEEVCDLLDGWERIRGRAEREAVKEKVRELADESDDEMVEG